jgi:hypothetical protein
MLKGSIWPCPWGQIDRKTYSCMFSVVKLQIPDQSYLACIITQKNPAVVPKIISLILRNGCAHWVGGDG